MPVRPIVPMLDATTRHRKASAYSLISGVIFGVGWLVWIDAVVRGEPDLPAHGWRSVAVSGAQPARMRACWSRPSTAVRRRVFVGCTDCALSAGVPIALCTFFLLALNATETDDVRQLCHGYSFGLQHGGVSSVLILAATLGVVAVGSSLALLLFYGCWMRAPGETWLAAAAAAATQLIFVAAIVFWVGRSNNMSLL